MKTEAALLVSQLASFALLGLGIIFDFENITIIIIIIIIAFHCNLNSIN